VRKKLGIEVFFNSSDYSLAFEYRYGEGFHFGFPRTNFFYFLFLPAKTSEVFYSQDQGNFRSGLVDSLAIS